MLTAWSDFLTQYRQNLHITGTLKKKKKNLTTKNTFYATMKQKHKNNDNDNVFRRTTELLSYGILLC